MKKNNVLYLVNRYKNHQCSRKGYLFWKLENETDLTPKEYGMFLKRSVKK